MKNDKLNFDEVAAEVWRSKHFAKMDSAFKTLLKNVLPVWYERLQHKDIIIESKLDEHFYEEDIRGYCSRILYAWWVEDELVTKVVKNASTYRLLHK